MTRDTIDNLKRTMVGKTIEIIEMDGEPMYSGRTGTITRVDDIGQLHGSWGSLAVNPNVDTYKVVR